MTTPKEGRELLSFLHVGSVGYLLAQLAFASALRRPSGRRSS